MKDNWIVGVYTSVKNEHDSKTLGPVLDNMEALIGKQPLQAVVDRGYRGKKKVGDTEVILPKPKKEMSRSYLKMVKRRSRIEAVIGHLKNDHRMGRNLLKGVIGDILNPKLAIMGWNLKKLMRKLLFVPEYFWLRLKICLIQFTTMFESRPLIAK